LLSPRGRAYAELGRLDRAAARASLHNALRLEPGHAAARELLAPPGGSL